MKFIKSLFLVTFFISNIWAQSFESDHFRIKKLDEGIYAAISKTGGYAIGNSGIVDLGDETLVFDTFISPIAARDLKQAAEVLTGNKVKYVINSHFHTDHIRGNQVFTDADIIASQITRDLIEEYEPEELEWEAKVIDQRIETTQQKLSDERDSAKVEQLKMWLGYYKAIKESATEYTITLPNFILKDSMDIHGKERNAILISKGEAHTKSDVVLWLPDEKILFSGDVIFINHHPWLGDGSPDEWIIYLNYLKTLNPKYIVPGHGPLGNKTSIDQMIKYLNNISDLVDSAIQNNFTEDEIKIISIPEEYQDWWYERFFPPNLVFLYETKTGNVDLD